LELPDTSSRLSRSRRRSLEKRETKETEVEVGVDLDGSGRAIVDTDVKFLNHMLESFATHSLVDLTVRARGDLQHHVVEDVAITLGRALAAALGERSGIRRFGYAIVPMDDALAVAAVDLIRRPYASVQMELERVLVEDAPREDIEHFLPSLTISLEATVHVRILDGKNDHHKIEASIKAFAIAFRDAATPDPRRGRMYPSSKGTV